MTSTNLGCGDCVGVWAQELEIAPGEPPTKKAIVGDQVPHKVLGGIGPPELGTSRQLPQEPRALITFSTKSCCFEALRGTGKAERFQSAPPPQVEGLCRVEVPQQPQECGPSPLGLSMRGLPGVDKEHKTNRGQSQSSEPLVRGTA